MSMIHHVSEILKKDILSRRLHRLCLTSSAFRSPSPFRARLARKGTFASRPFPLTFVLLASVLIILVPIPSRAATHVVPSGPLVPAGPVDGSTATTVFTIPGAATSSVASGPLVPAGPVDGSTATASFSVTSAMAPAGAALLSVRLRITFAKVGGGNCPGPRGGDDWAEEVSFRLTSPSGVTVTLVNNDYLFSAPDVGQVTVTFDDSAASTVTGRKIQSGSFRPSVGAMADFLGQDPGGEWVLTLADNAAQDPLCFTAATLLLNFDVDPYLTSAVTIDINFAKVGGGGCPGPGGGDDWAEEVSFRLTSPSGVTVTLVNNDYLFSAPDVGQVTVTFDDSAASTVTGRKIQSGSFRPSVGAMADFLGQDPGGEWVLTVADNAVQDPLCFGSATLHVGTTIETYTVNAGAGANGSLDGSTPSPAIVDHGATASFTFNADPGYHVASISGCGGPAYTNTSNAVGSYTYTTGAIKGDCTVTATFAINTYNVIASAGANGSLDGSTPSPAIVDHGSTASFTFNADPGYHVASVSGCGGAAYSNTSNGVSSYTYTTGAITGNCTVTAAFAIDTYSVSASAGPNGSLDGSTPSPAIVDHGSTASFTFNADPGYHVASVSGCGGLAYTNTSNAVGSYTYTTGEITGDCTVTATFAINTYSVSASAGANGSLDGSTPSPAIVNHGSTTSFTFNADPGYHVASVSGCGGAAYTNTSNAVNSYTYTTGPVTGDCTVTATFAINTYSVSASAGPNGSLDGSTPSPAIVNHGSTTSFTFNADPGYHVASVSGCGGPAYTNTSNAVDSHTYTTGPITGDCTVTATFAINIYTLTVINGAGGGNYLSGYVATISANTPPAGQVFDQWTGDTAHVSNIHLPNTTVAMPGADITLTAVYKDQGVIHYPLTVNNGAGSGDYLPGATVDLTAAPAPAGQIFDQWTGDTATIMNIYLPDTTLVMPSAATTVAATYKIKGETTHTLTVNSGTGGGDYLPGAAVDLTADPAPAGQVFDQWTGDRDTITNILLPGTTLIMPSAAAAVTATYKDRNPTLYTLTVSGGAGGGDYLAGDIVPISAILPVGHSFDQWTGQTAWAADIRQADTTLIMPEADIAVAALFTINTYTLTYTAGANGSITGPVLQRVNYGDSGEAVTAVPDTGYHFVQWSDGVATASRTDTKVTADINVTATFAINQYTLTYMVGPGGTINGVNPQTVLHGASGTMVEAVPNAGFRFVRWSDYAPDNPRMDASVTGYLVVTAEFEAMMIPDDEEGASDNGQDDGDSGDDDTTGPSDTGDDDDFPPDLDLDDNGIPDSDQDNMHVGAIFPGGPYFSLLIPDGNVLEYLEWIDDAVITDMNNRPDVFPLGLVRFRVFMPFAVDTLELVIYCSEPIPEGAVWYKHDPVNGWYDYSAHAVISEDRMSMTLSFQDGGVGDADGAVNGVIEDPSGPALFNGDDSGSDAEQPSDDIDPEIPGDEPDTGNQDSDASGRGNDGGCFLKTVFD